jgi:hypothetical protein
VRGVARVAGSFGDFSGVLEFVQVRAIGGAARALGFSGSGGVGVVGAGVGSGMAGMGELLWMMLWNSALCFFAQGATLKDKAATLPDSAATLTDNAAAFRVKTPAFRLKADALRAKAAVLRDEPVAGSKNAGSLVFSTSNRRCSPLSCRSFMAVTSI